MSDSERVEELQLSLALAAISLVGYQEHSTQAFVIAKSLGYQGDFVSANVREWLKEFAHGPIAKRVADRAKAGK
jgi:hypothetical protein